MIQIQPMTIALAIALRAAATPPAKGTWLQHKLGNRRSETEN
jgi:hypothetical protein